MEKNAKTKQLLKILIAAAWIDGIIQPEERQYLRQKVKKNNLTNDPEIRILLSEIEPVKPAQCYQWMEEYLGDRPNEQDYQHLLEEISFLIYSDNEISAEESQLLTQLELFESASKSNKSVFDNVLKLIQKIYKSGINEKVQ